MFIPASNHVYPQADVSALEGSDTTQQARVIYKVPCSDCLKVYIGQTRITQWDWWSTEEPKQAKTQPNHPWQNTLLPMNMPLNGEVPRWLTLTISSNKYVCWNPGISGSKRPSWTGRRGMSPPEYNQLVTVTLPQDALHWTSLLDIPYPSSACFHNFYANLLIFTLFTFSFLFILYSYHFIFIYYAHIHRLY